MQSQSSSNINYWPGFVDAFSNLVLALVFVIVILAMSLGMFSGIMAKMAIQRALVEQRLDESRAASASLAGDGTGGASAGGKDPAARAVAQPQARDGGDQAQDAPAEEVMDASDSADDVKAQASPPAQPASAPPGSDPRPEQTAEAGGDAPGMPAAVHAEPASSADVRAVSGGREGAARDDASPMREAQGSAAAAREEDALEHATLRRENDALRQELAALRKKQAALEHGAGNGAGRNEAGAGKQKPVDKFGPTMPQEDRRFRQQIEDDLQRTLKEFEARRDSGASIDVVIYVPNYALTENKRTALFYLISIKDYLMKRKVAPGQIRMHMTPAPAGQKDMTVSMSVEP